MLPFARVTIIGLGLIGSSIARGVRAAMPTVRVTGHDASAAVRDTARRIDLCDDVTDTVGAAVTDADLVILCVPVGAMGEVAAQMQDDLPADAIVSDVGSCKADVARALTEALPHATIVPAHPVAGTEQSGPEAGFASLFHRRWCIVTPLDGGDPAAAERVAEFWRRLGSDVETMAPAHHDLVLAVTSHLPHLIAYTIVGTASDLEAVTQSEVIKFSAGGFRDFTRIAASDPTMWATCSWPTRTRCWKCSSASARTCHNCSARSAGATATPCSTGSRKPARSAARSSTRGRTMRRRTSDGGIPESLRLMASFAIAHAGGRSMGTMNISLPDPMRDYVQGRIESGHYASASDYVRDLIRRDQSGIENEDRWLRDLNASIVESIGEMHAGGGVDLDAACDAIIADWRTVGNPARR